MIITRQEAESIVKDYARNYFHARRIEAIVGALANTTLLNSCHSIAMENYLCVFELIYKNILSKNRVLQIIADIANELADECKGDYILAVHDIHGYLETSYNTLKNQIDTDCEYCDGLAYSTYNLELKEEGE